MGEAHIKPDVKVGWQEVVESQEIIKKHLKTLNNVFRTGEFHGKKAMTRAREARSVVNLVIPNLYLMAKDHKPVGPDGLPKCRPVCAASRSINQEMSEWISQILDAASEGDTESAESCSTEDMLSQLDELN